ncbi:PREDICTED: uncharacterized protein LOC109581670 [Amphimedon queenslandica]|uniref:Death domain-containing protein n=1 Tax=Amphimedon queenslandica TaxID=400682 RepID=A0AAN0J3F6_AMPQE|nr:PREDICTED: uncharacterized protein LOC109581670 [Amphimedon queenslandica]|eukprot:XP_019851545.1 PREDICTED: uncharacterized protein LOC109581670 [Amphimedon queenslandica]
MSFVFQEYSNFTLNGPYIYLLLTHFSGVSATSTAELNFQGILFKSFKDKYIWDYSFVVYISYADAILNNKVLAEYDVENWPAVTKKMVVEFEQNSTSIILNLPSLQDWDIIETTSPLVCYKNHLMSQHSVNMQFMLRWKGHGFPSGDFVTLHLSGALLPVKITFYTNSIKRDKDQIHIEKQLDTTNLEQILSLLKKNNYDASTWHRLCLRLGLLEETLNTIKADENNVYGCQKTCLHKWLERADKVDDKGGATWTSLEKALKDIDQKAVAENMRKSRAHSEL